MLHHEIEVGKLLFTNTPIPSHLEFPGSCSQLGEVRVGAEGLRRLAGASFTADLSPHHPGINQAYPPTHPHPLPLSLLLGPALSFMFTLPMSPNPNGNLSFCLHQVTLFDGSFLERNKSLQVDMFLSPTSS